MNKINEILEYGLLAELAYLKLENEYFQENNQYVGNYKGRPDNQGSYGNKINIKNFIKGEHVLDEDNEAIPLVEEERYKLTDIKFNSINVILSLLNRYSIIDFENAGDYTGSGFQAMLLQKDGTEEYVIAFRGTAGIKDLMVDAAMIVNKNPQNKDALEFTKRMLKEHTIKKEDLTLTGHSLGGIHVQTVGTIKRIRGFAYNPLGSSKLLVDIKVSSFYLNMLMNTIVSNKLEKYVDEDWLNDNMLSISYNDVGNLNGDILSNIATKLNGSKHLGMKIDIFGEDKGLSAHGMSGLNEILALQKEENLVTIADIRDYNNNEKTLLLDAMKKRKIDVLLTLVKNKKCIFAVQTTQEIKSIIMSNNSLIENLNHKNTDSLRVNGTITELEDKDNFNNKLYYNYEKNVLKVKTKDFKEAANLSRIVIKENGKLKKRDVIIELQGEA
ncbi:MAG: DUF2974 domain-containing protein [Campylobacteraceae bacterium]|nr:DUF2974 domain-containing protein [Campylobacteraceae bacterium]